MRNTIISLLFLAALSGAEAENVAEKAKYKRSEALNQIVYLEVPLRNFGSEKPELVQQYNDVKQKYSVALSFFFEDNFVQSYKLLLEVQDSLEKLYEQVSLFYIDRTNVVLQQSVKEATEIEFRYNRKAPFATQAIGKEREAGRRQLAGKSPENKEIEGRLYDPKDVHYLYDKKVMIDNIDYAYMRLGQAKLARQNAMDLEKWLEKGKPMPPTMKKSRIESYKAVIDLCRQAKVNGILVMQLNRIYDNYELQTRFKDNYFMKEKRLDPVFDFAIPDDFVKDASDSRNQIHEHSERIMVKSEDPALVTKEGRPTVSKAKRFDGGNSKQKNP
ncbi:MAG: hypothetical protein JSR44_08220 [Spirochaetes bacterium]|nr:hypothetical protein [Spirochaetota bacterium]